MRKIITMIPYLGILALLLATACSKEMRGPEEEAEQIVKRVRCGISGQNVETLALGEAAVQTKTMIRYIDTATVTPHRVMWDVGDKVYSYAQSGVYMDYVLKNTDIPVKAPGEPLRGYECNCEVIYRLGDAFYNAYVKGSKIGGYKGRRMGTSITFENGIPNQQNGRFTDYHICIGQDVPEVDEFLFKNMQTYIRFKTIGNDLDPGTGKGKGTITGEFITKITVKSVTKENMAGDMAIEYNGGWRYTLQNRSNPNDSMIVVTPVGGTFSNNTDYYIAIPVRKYSKGFQLDFFNASDRRLSYVKTPSIVLNYSQIYNCDDILQFVVILAKDLELYYDGVKVACFTDQDPATHSTVTIPEITAEENHTGLLESKILAVETTDKSLVWEVTSGSDYLTIYQDGSFDAVKPGTATIKVSTQDGSNVICQLKIKVVAEKGMTGGSYSSGTYSGGFD